MYIVDWIVEDSFRGFFEFGMVLDIYFIRIVLFKDCVILNLLEGNIEMFLVIYRVLRWGILIIRLMVKFRNYIFSGGFG